MSRITATPRVISLPEVASELLARLRRAVLDWRLPLLVLLCAAGLLAAYQRPLQFSFQVGHDGGYATDRPYLTGFRSGEGPREASWRWSLPEAAITVPGVGERPLLIGFTVVSHRQDWQPQAPPTTLLVDSGAGALTQITLARGPARNLELYVPARAVEGGVLRVGLRTEGWQNPADERGPLGVALGGRFTLTEAGAGRFVWPGTTPLITFPLAIGILWVAARAAGLGANTAFGVLLALPALVALLASIAAPRLASGAEWAVEASLLALLAALFGALLVPPLLRRWRIPHTPATLRWLIVLIALSFAIKYGGQFHPVAMRGDLQLHIHRYSRTVSGEVYIPAQHRGLPFPFPSGWYAGIAPLHLTGAPIGNLFELTAGIFEATAVLLAFMLVARVTGSATGGLLGAIIYTISPVWMLNLWWQFHTQIASQWFLLALVTLLVLRWPNYDDRLTWGWAVTLFVLVCLSHIGSFLNLGAVAVVALPWLWLRARTPAERRGVRMLALAGLATGLFVALFYYSAFWGKIATQITGIAAEGMVGVTEKAPVPREVLLRSLWQDGLIEHYGMFLVLLGIAGAALVSLGPRERQGLLPPLLWSTFLVVLLQAFLPLLTQSSVTTRYLTFGGWAFTLGSGVAGLWLWRRGPIARLALVIMLSAVAWVSGVIWIDAMAFNTWPAEPF